MLVGLSPETWLSWTKLTAVLWTMMLDSFPGLVLIKGLRSATSEAVSSVDFFFPTVTLLRILFHGN